MPTWLEIIIPCPVSDADDLASLVSSELPSAANGTEIRAGEIVFWVSVEESERVLDDTRRLVAALAERGAPLDPARVRSRPAVPEEEWRDAWKRYFHVTRITRQLVIVPSWESFQPGSDDLVIHLDPGQAFGTGAHASTRLLLEAMQRLRDEGVELTQILDVGAGSGILAIAAALLWPASRALAIDVDPIAVDCARDNAAHNQLDARITSAATPVGEVAGTFDLVCANIQADVLLALREPIAARVGRGGRLLLAGLLTGQAEGVAAEYTDGTGLTLERIERSAHDPEWSSAILRREA